MRLIQRLFLWVCAALIGAALPAHALDPAEIAGHVAQARVENAAGKYDAAYGRLRYLLLNDTAGDPENPARADAYRQLLWNLKRAKPLSFGLSAALLPSTNPNRQSAEAVFETAFGPLPLGDPTRDASGIGLTLGFRADATHAYARGREWVFGLGLEAGVHDDARNNNLTRRLSMTHHWLASGATYALGIAAADTKTQAPDEGSRTLSASARLDTRLSARNLMGLALTLRDRRADDATLAYRDGTTTTLAASLLRQLGPRTSVTVIGSLERADLAADHLSYDALRLGAGWRQAETNGLTWDLSYAHTWRDFAADFTALTYPRADRVDEVTFGVSHRAITVGGGTPRASCTWREHGSNVALYDYRALDCAVTLSRDF